MFKYGKTSEQLDKQHASIRMKQVKYASTINALPFQGNEFRCMFLKLKRLEKLRKRLRTKLFAPSF